MYTATVQYNDSIQRFFFLLDDSIRLDSSIQSDEREHLRHVTLLLRARQIELTRRIELNRRLELNRRISNIGPKQKHMSE